MNEINDFAAHLFKWKLITPHNEYENTHWLGVRVMTEFYDDEWISDYKKIRLNGGKFDLVFTRVLNNKLNMKDDLNEIGIGTYPYMSPHWGWLYDLDDEDEATLKYLFNNENHRVYLWVFNVNSMHTEDIIKKPI